MEYNFSHFSLLLFYINFLLVVIYYPFYILLRIFVCFWEPFLTTVSLNRKLTNVLSASMLNYIFIIFFSISFFCLSFIIVVNIFKCHEWYRMPPKVMYWHALNLHFLSIFNNFYTYEHIMKHLHIHINTHKHAHTATKYNNTNNKHTYTYKSLKRRALIFEIKREQQLLSKTVQILMIYSI